MNNMRYQLFKDGKLRAQAEYLADLCFIVSAYTGEIGIQLSQEYCERGSLKRGALLIEPIIKEGQ